MADDTQAEDQLAAPLDMSEVAAVPAVFSNHVHIASSNAFMRITFGEKIPGAGDVYRTGVVLALETAQQLVAGIIGQLANRGIEFDIVQPEAPAADDAN